MSTMTLSHPARPTIRPAVRTGSVRLTRRGRLVVFAAALLAALVLGLVWGATSSATEKPGRPEPTRIIQVQPGDTLYGIASGLDTGGDVNARIAHIQRLNALDSGVLHVGQKLRIPLDD